MQRIHEQYQLRNNHTFGTSAVAALFAEPKSVKELEEVLQYAREHKLVHFIIGEGSNLLFTEDYHGLIIHPLITGIEVLESDQTSVLLRVGAGVNWDSFAQYCVEKQWYGTENLSLIPGSVGAAPVQNIGAYGVEAKDLIERVEAYDTNLERCIEFLNNDCEFGYRDSFFKQSDNGRYVVTHVLFKLKKQGELQLDYGNVRDKFNQMPEQSLQGLRDAIIQIRESKLPDPEKTGNAGSFFKNPVIASKAYETLRNQYPDIPGFPTAHGNMKVPAAWLIEQTGWKGVRKGNTGTWPLQPLVIVNYGGAHGKEIFNFSKKIQLAVAKKFGVELQREVTVL